MKKILAVFFIVLVGQRLLAQLTYPPSGDNQKATVIQNIGLATVSINYSSPDIHGPNGEDRKGHIWGELVHYGFIDQGYGPSKAAPWRAGANENTIISFSHDVKIGGKDLKAGSYGLLLAVEKDGPWTWVFSKNYTSWGSYYYDSKDDALRVQATPKDAAYTEYLTYSFDDRLPNSAVAFLQWENKRVDFKIEIPNINELYTVKMDQELIGSTAGFSWQSYVAAAQFAVQNKVSLEKGLEWAETAVSGAYIGEENFTTLQTKAQVLAAMGKDGEADAIMDKALKHPTATTQSIHQYGRSLLALGKNQKALDVFKLNRQLHPTDMFTTYVGLARGYTAVNDKKNAIKNWELAIKNLPQDQKANEAAYKAELNKLKG